MSENKHAARSANAILGWPDLPGLSPLPPDQNARLSFVDQRVALAELLNGTLAERSYRRALSRIENSSASPEDESFVSQYKPVAHLMEWASVDTFFDQVASEVPEPERPEFDRQREWACIAAETGKLPDDAGRLDLDRPERQLLWAAAIIHAYGNEQITTKEFDHHPMVRAVTHSRFVDGVYNQLAYRLPAECVMTLGAPGSWFYFRPDPKHPVINLDLCHSLIAGGGLYTRQGGYLGHFEPVAHHEIGHAKFSLFYPESMQALWKRMADLAAKGGQEVPESFIPGGWTAPEYPPTSQLTIDEYKEFLALRAEFGLRQRFWNACEDNCVNRYSVNLCDSNHIKDSAQRHMGNLADSQNVFRTIVETRRAAQYYHDMGYARETEDSPSTRLANLQHTVNMAFYVRNRLAPDTPEGRASINIHDELLPPDSWEDIKSITQRIEELQPHALDGPGRRYSIKDLHTDEIHNVNFRGKSALFNQWRNEEIEKLLELADPYIQQIMDEVRQKIDQQVEALKHKEGSGKERSKKENSGEGLRVEGLEGQEDGNLPAGTPQGQKDQDNTRETSANKGRDADAGPDARQGETAGSRRRREENGLSPDGYGEQSGQPSGKQADPEPKPREIMPTGNTNQLAGNQRSALDKVNLGDGRSYRELRQDPSYREAVKEAARRLKEMSEHVTQRVAEVRPARYDLPGGSGVMQRLDHPRLRALSKRLGQGEARVDDFRVVRREETTSKPVTHDIVMVIDGSGSMGVGKGSRMEIAMKTAALMYDGIRELHKQNPDHTHYRLFISLWGDEADWSKDKEAAGKYLISEPGMKDSEVETRIERILHGIASGTQLAPAFPNMIGRIRRHELPPDHKHGMTHFIIPSDGELYDTQASKDWIQRVLNAMPNSTIDALITENAKSNELKDVIQQLQQGRYKHRVNVTETDWKHAPSQVVGMLKGRQHSGAERLEPLGEEEFQTQLNACAKRGGMAMEAP